MPSHLLWRSPSSLSPRCWASDRNGAGGDQRTGRTSSRKRCPEPVRSSAPSPTVQEETTIRMGPTPADETDPSGLGTPEPQEPPPPAGATPNVAEDDGRSGKVFVVVMAILMIGVAIFLSLASRSLSGADDGTTGSGGQPVTAEP